MLNKRYKAADYLASFLICVGLIVLCPDALPPPATSFWGLLVNYPRDRLLPSIFVD